MVFKKIRILKHFQGKTQSINIKTHCHLTRWPVVVRMVVTGRPAAAVGGVLPKFDKSTPKYNL